MCPSSFLQKVAQILFKDALFFMSFAHTFTRLSFSRSQAPFVLIGPFNGEVHH